MSDAFYKSSFFLNYSTLLYDGAQMQELLVIVSVLVSHQYYFCVVKKWTRNVYNPCIQKVRNAVKVFCSLNVGHVRTPIL